jgi:tyrosine-protein phosphatase SIW14
MMNILFSIAHIFRSLRVLAAALPLAITLCASQEPQPQIGSSASQPVRPFGHKRKLKGIANFGEVTPTIFRGAQPSYEGFEGLAKMGIDIVVDGRGNRTGSEGKEVGKLGMQYVPIPWHCPHPDDDVFVRFLKVFQENPNKKVFVHCRLGEDRTGMMVAAYRMAKQGWTADEAMQEMHLFGFSSFHHVFCPGLASYERSFPERLKSNPAFEGLHSSTREATE